MFLLSLLFYGLHIQKFRIPTSASRWRRRLFYFLRDKLRVPGKQATDWRAYWFLNEDDLQITWLHFLLTSIDILLMAIFSISLKAWACIVLWFSLAPVAHRWDLGPVYVSMLCNLNFASDFRSKCLLLICYMWLTTGLQASNDSNWI